ncbi:MAG: zinc-ribbon domain-containing protein [Bacteroidota bacterium]
MKFCPQCGTTFEPEARFCLECGFDRSSVEPMTTPTEKVPQQTPVNLVCPQCGTVLVPGDRFCLECGYDTLTTKPVENENQKPLEPIVVEAIPPFVPIAEPEIPIVNKSFCPQCGTTLALAERFCEQCGFDTTSIGNPGNNIGKPRETPQPAYIPPVTENRVPPPPVPKQKPVSQPPPPEPVRPPKPSFGPSASTAQPGASPKSKKKWLWISLAAIVLIGLGAIGWYEYNNQNKSEVATVDTVSSAVIADIPEVDTTPVSTDIMENPADVAPEKPKPQTKPLSRIDQELAKQKAKQQNKTNQQTSAPAPTAKPDLSVKTTNNTATTKENYSKVLHEVGQSDEPKSKGPKKPTKFSLSKTTMIVRITTDHFNGGMGTSSGGTIILKDKSDNVIGSYRAYGKSGKNGTPNAKWVAEPRKMLEKGTYYISDSDMSTWSKNILGIGFVVVEGYEVE